MSAQISVCGHHMHAVLQWSEKGIRDPLELDCRPLQGIIQVLGSELRSPPKAASAFYCALYPCKLFLPMKFKIYINKKISVTVFSP